MPIENVEEPVDVVQPFGDWRVLSRVNESCV